MKKFLIAEAEKARILGMHYNAMGKKIINEQKMLDFGGVFQALSVSDWFNTPDVTAQWKQGAYRDQESKMKGYNDYVMSKYNEVTPFVQNDPSALIGKTLIVWNPSVTAELKPSDVVKTFPVSSIYCGNKYDNVGDTVVKKYIYFFTQPQTVGDLTWNQDRTQAYDSKKTNIVPSMVNGPTFESPDLYVPDNNPILGLRVVRPNGTYYMFDTKTLQTFEDGKTAVGDLRMPNTLYQAGQYAGMEMPQFNIQKVEPTKKRKQ